MKISIQIESKNSEMTSHLKRSLHTLFRDLNFEVKIFPPGKGEWKTLEAIRDSADHDFEVKVDRIFWRHVEE